MLCTSRSRNAYTLWKLTSLSLRNCVGARLHSVVKDCWPGILARSTLEVIPNCIKSSCTHHALKYTVIARPCALRSAFVGNGMPENTGTTGCPRFCSTNLYLSVLCTDNGHQSLSTWLLKMKSIPPSSSPPFSSVITPAFVKWQWVFFPGFLFKAVLNLHGTSV